MSDERELLYWKLTPVYHSPGGIATACTVNCLATGAYLSGYGGPAYALSPKVVAALDAKKNDARSRVVVDGEIYDRTLDLLGRIVAERSSVRSDEVERALQELRDGT